MRKQYYAWRNENWKVREREHRTTCTKDKVQEFNVNSGETEVTGRKINDKEKSETSMVRHTVSVGGHNGIPTVYKVLKQCNNWE